MAFFLVDLMFNRNDLWLQDFLLNKMKIGRPKLAADEKKGQITGVRLKSDERQLVEKAASLRSLKLSAWMRETLLKRAALETRGCS